MSAQEARGRVLRILCFARDRKSREFVAGTLRKDGQPCEFFEAATEAEVESALQNADIDLIVSDLPLPSYRQASALAAARKAVPEIPLLILPKAADGPADRQPPRPHNILAPRFGRQRTADAPLKRILREVSARRECKEAERALRVSEARLRATLDNTPNVAVQWFDEHGRVTYWNPASERLFGWSAAEALGKTLDHTIHTPEQAAAFREALDNIARTGQPAGLAEYNFNRRDGSPGACLSTLFEISAPEGSRCFVCMDVDISERKKAEDALASSMARLIAHESALIALTKSHSADLALNVRRLTEASAAALDVARVSFWRYERGRNVLRCFDLFERDSGRHGEGMILDGSKHPRYFNAIKDSDLIAADQARCHPLTSELSPDYLAPHGITSMMDVPVRIHGAMDGVLCLEHTGPERQWKSDERTFAMAIGNLLSLALEEAERRSLEEQCRHAQKMEAIGQFAGGIAHDFNNMLGVLKMQSSLLLAEPELPAPLKPHVEEITSTVERASNLTRQLLTFSRRKAARPANLDISEVLGAMITLLRRVLGGQIALETRFAPSLPLIHADPSMLEQVLMNLVLNARDAMPEGGRLVVSVESAERGPDRLAAHPGISPGPFVLLSVSDTGCGIAPENLSRIFEPFFSTKEAGKGTGLGLATVFSIVDQHRGWIDVESAPGRGSTFRVFLPAL